MKELLRSGFLLLVLLSTSVQASCRRGRLPIDLGSFTESKVTVDISLNIDENDQAWLMAKFTPEEGKHLYSKDIPRDGVDGLGRPTLLEIQPDSKMTVVGVLSESVAAIPNPDNQSLPIYIYPEGPLTLSLPILLPEGAGWFDEYVSITYMACSEGLCFPPVVGKQVAVKIPGIEEVHP